jgi:heterotetrameric sarcosine oxidase delta subunit
MGLLLRCPNCGAREYHEFWYGGEHRPPPAYGAGETYEAHYERVWLRENLNGLQAERWFHFAGCRRWITVERDTGTNEVHSATPSASFPP